MYRRVELLFRFFPLTPLCHENGDVRILGGGGGSAELCASKNQFDFGLIWFGFRLGLGLWEGSRSSLGSFWGDPSEVQVRSFGGPK